MNDSTWMSADPHLASSLSPSQDERMRSPQNLHSQEDDDSSSESGSGNGSSTLNPSTSSSTQGDPAFPEMNGNGTVAPMDFTASAEDQPINLCDKLPQGSTLGTPSYPSDGCGADGLRSRVKYGVKTTPESPPYSSGSYDSIKTEVSGCPEDLTVGRAPTADDDDDDHDDHEDNDKMNDSEGMDPERLKAFNMFVRLFVDENLDRMVPISKQPKEKIQAIIESCSRQFPEFQERARKRIRTYLKSCRRMKKNGMEMTRPTPPHLTSAMAENILAAACESETRKAAKRMRLEIYQSSQDEPVALDKQHSRDPTAITHSTYSLPASYSQDPVYVNGGLNYSYRGYGALGSNLQPPASLQTGNHSNGRSTVQQPCCVGTRLEWVQRRSCGREVKSPCRARGEPFSGGRRWWAHGPQHERRGLHHLHHAHAHPLQQQHQPDHAHCPAQPHRDQRRAAAHRRLPRVRRLPAALGR
uniref:Nucleolar protein 4 like n=1 Tax=Bos taurus TaxID=9913 RepID=A0ABI0NLD8_BOVIN